MPNSKNRFKNKEEENAWYREYRAKNREKFREYNRKYNKENRKKLEYRSEKKYALLNPEKRKAVAKVNYQIRKGNLTRGNCEVCGKEKAQAHHDDYTKPLEVRWLCPVHHSEHHRNLAKLKEGVDKSI